MEKLKPCPFCGTEVNVVAIEEGFSWNPIDSRWKPIVFKATITCSECCKNSNYRVCFYSIKDDEQKAIDEVTKHWNRRYEEK